MERRGHPRRIPKTLWGLIIGIALGNSGLAQAGNPVSSWILGPGLTAIVALLLLGIDLRAVRRVQTDVLAAFALLLLGTAAGGGLAIGLLQPLFGDSVIGLAAALSASYSGGAVNFLAVSHDVGMDGSLFASAIAVDNVVTGAWLALALTCRARNATPSSRILPRRSLVQPPAPSPAKPPAPSPAKPPDELQPLAAATAGATPVAMREDQALAAITTVRHRIGSILVATGASALLALALASVAVRVADALPGGEALWVTPLALLTLAVPALRGLLQPSKTLRQSAVVLLMVAVGSTCRFAELGHSALIALPACALVVGAHALTLMALTHSGRFDPDALWVASQAAIGGPSTAVAVAEGRNRPELAVAAVALGVLGYGLGTAIGLALFAMLA